MSDVVIVGGIGQRALTLFSQNGILVVAGEAGQPVESLVGTYLKGGLTAQPEGCAHHGHDHDHHHAHGEGHEHGHGQHGEGCHQHS